MRQGIYGLLGLEKINRVAFLEVMLLVENPSIEWKFGYFP